MKINNKKLGISMYKTSFITVIIILFAMNTGCGTQQSAGNESKEEMKARQERQEAYLQELEHEREQRDKREREAGYIDLYSDISGIVLINGNATETRIKEYSSITIVLENASGKTYKLAVREDNGILFEAAPISIIVTGPYSKYSVSIVDTRTNKQEDFEVIQNTTGITIEKYIGKRKNVIIPETLYGQKVTVIGNDAFNYMPRWPSRSIEKQLSSVILPGTITSIENYAFYGNLLDTIIIPNSVISIGRYAFADCGLTSVKLGNRLQYIGEFAFNRNELTEITIPQSLAPRRTERSLSKQGEIIITVLAGICNYNFGHQNITRVTFPANMDDGNLDGFNIGLVNFYKSQNKRAGTYVKNGPVWVRE